MTLHRLDQNGKHNPQTLAANTVRGLPQNDQSVVHRIVINPSFQARLAPITAASAAEKPSGMLAMQPRYSGELVQYATAYGAVATSISFTRRCYQIVSRRHADLPHLLAPLP